MRIYLMMKGDAITKSRKSRTPLSWIDALILGGAVLGFLIGISLLSAQAAVIAGVVALAFVVVKLLTTKP